MNWAEKFMDFAPARDLVLLSSYSDYSLMHNQITYDLFRDLSKSHHQEFAPKHYLIELFLNDEYQGVYEICENVDASLLGLNVFKENELNHSVLYKAVMRSANFGVIAPEFYEQKEPDLKFGEYWRPYKELVKFVGRSPSNVFQRDVKKIIDVENAIDFQILLAFTNQMDGPDHNLFIARNNRPGDKFFIVPWDYDKSFGGPYDRMRISSLSHRLMKDFPEYIPALQARWNELRGSVLSETSLMDRVDRIEEKIRDAASRNFKLWPIPDGKTHEIVVQEMKSWIKKRLVFLDEYMKNLGTKQ
jgi:spore coat protein CotH